MSSDLCQEVAAEGSQTVTVTEEATDVAATLPSTSLCLTLRPDPNQRRISWATGTVDNEHLNRKKSKCCCVYTKPRKFGESSSDSEEETECEHCRGHVEKRAKPEKKGGSTENQQKA